MIFLRDTVITALFVLLDGIAVYSLCRAGISYGTGAALKLLIIGFGFLRAGALFTSWTAQLLLRWRAGAWPHPSVWWLLVPNLLILGILIYGTYIEPMRLTVTRIEMAVPGLLQPARIVQLSDIHLEYTTAREAELPGLVQSFNPDMIVITGDLPNESYANDDKMVAQLNQLLSQLHAPLGVHAVNGNAELTWIKYNFLKKINVHWVNDVVFSVPEFAPNFKIVGLGFNEHDYDLGKLKKLMSEVSGDDFTLLLYHKPDLAFDAEALGVDVYLAGHTHGGQVRLPLIGAIVTNSRHGKEFEMGRYQVGQMTLFVSRGLGFTGGMAPRIRFLAPPEVVVIDLVPALDSSK